jgi:two-component system OmpR family sensor kinase
VKLLGTFVGRIAAHGLLSALAAGVTVALVTVWMADDIARQSEDRVLLDVCEQFALELREREADPVWLTRDETWELQHTGISVAVFEKERRISGDPALATLAPETCMDQGALRVCARSAYAYTAVVGRAREALDRRRAEVVHATLFAVLIAGVLSALASRLLARIVVRPLHQLREAVSQVSEQEPASADLGPPVGLAEIDELRQALRDTLVRLGLSLAESERFAHDAAHELRTPLTAMLGELELLAERTDGAVRSDILRVHAIALRQAKLIERLLVLARQGASRETEHVDLADVIEMAIESLSPCARPRIEVALPQRGALVAGDSALLTSMMGNALDNALKFSAERVRCSLRVHEQRATIAVHDEGPGIAAEERERVFLPFYRTAESRGSGVHGHGIGLALIAHVAALHGGSARFAHVARGAQLELQLPLCAG